MCRMQIDRDNPPKKVFFNGVEYTRLSKGLYYLSYSMTNVGRKNPKGLHVAIWEHANNAAVQKGYEVNHIDRNTFNCDPTNLECMPKDMHRRLPRTKDTIDKLRLHAERIRPLSKAWHSSPEGIEWHRLHAIESFKKRTVVKRACQYRNCMVEFDTKFGGQRFCSRQ